MAERPKQRGRKRSQSIRRGPDSKKTRNKPTSRANSSSELRGVVSKTRTGMAWLERVKGPDLRFGRKDESRLGDGDLVLARISASRGVKGLRRGRRSERVELVQVLERARPEFAGIVQAGSKLEPLGRQVPQQYRYRTQSKPPPVGTLVVAKWQPGAGKDGWEAEGYALIERILGRPEEAGVATELALANFDIRCEWPEEVRAECENLSGLDDARNRKDMRQVPFVTIDGAQARDFDDALHCKPLEKGGWLLRVAIADVSAYVREDTALDREAVARGTSVYFSDRVVPMLPEELSEDRCSLVPGEDRPVAVCEIDMDKTGQIRKWRFYRALIRSAARLVYENIEPALTHPDCRHESAQGRSEELKALREVGEAMGRARQERNALRLEIPEVQVTREGDDQPVRQEQSGRVSSQLMVENAMLAANTCAAEELKRLKRPGPMRVCDQPTAEKWQELKTQLQQMDIEVPGDQPSLIAYNRLIEQIIRLPNASFLQREVVRTLQLAIYSINTTIGHFPLALDSYTHFTSPIRRYPDLLVHRLLFADPEEPSIPDEQVVEKLCELCSRTERQAEWASRQEQMHLQCLLLGESVGQWFSASIGRIFRDGLYIYLTDPQVRGFMNAESVPNEYRIEASKEMQRLVPRQPGGGKKYRQLIPGSEVEVRLGSVCPEKQEVLLDGLRLPPAGA